MIIMQNAEGATADLGSFSLPATPRLDAPCSLEIVPQDTGRSSSAPPTGNAAVLISTAPNRGFPRSGRPRTHRCSHAGCERDFTSAYTLSRHTQAHLGKSNQRSFPCTIGCAITFSRKHDLFRHEVAQHGKVCDAQCPKCFSPYSSDATLLKHKCKARARQ